MSAMDQQGLLAKLAALNIQHENHSHGPVMTCEAQAAALAGVQGVITKNLFLKDKKGRFYIVTAAADTPVDLKQLSVRLGCGKGGIRMAPDEAIGAILQVPLGSVTPLALAQPTAAGVGLLLDAGLQQQPRICVHPLDNRTTTVLSPAGLEAFLRSLGREPGWVDLVNAPKIDKDNPPDLHGIAEAAAVIAPEEKGPAAVGKGESMPVLHAKGAAAAKPPPAAPARPAPRGVQQRTGPRADDVNRVTDELVAQIASTLMGGEAAAAVDGDKLRQLKADVAMQLNALRNAAYAGGFAAARGAIAATLAGDFA